MTDIREKKNQPFEVAANIFEWNNKKSIAGKKVVKAPRYSVLIGGIIFIIFVLISPPNNKHIKLITDSKPKLLGDRLNISIDIEEPIVLYK